MSNVLRALLGVIATKQTRPAATTLDPANKGAAVSLSGGNLTATSSAEGTVLSTTSKASGKWYFEATISNFGGNSVAVGLTNGAQGLTGSLGTDANHSVGCFSSNVMLKDGGVVGGISTVNPSSGDVLGVFVDVDNAKFWVIDLTNSGGMWNDGGQTLAQVEAGTGGISLSTLTGPIFAGATVFGAGPSAVFNFGASAFTGVVPTGGAAWT